MEDYLLKKLYFYLSDFSWYNQEKKGVKKIIFGKFFSILVLNFIKNTKTIDTKKGCQKMTA